MMESITYNLGEFYLPDANPGGASSDVLSASLLPLETVSKFWRCRNLAWRSDEIT